MRYARKVLRRVRAELRCAIDVIGYRVFDKLDLRHALSGRKQLAANEGYDLWAPHYDASDNPLIAVEIAGAHALMEHLSFETVLDAACGTGRHALPLAKAQKAVTALDFNGSMLEMLKEKATGEGLPENRLRTVRGDLRRPLPFSDATFDLVLCMLALEHLADITLPLREFWRVLHPGGFLIYSTLHPELTKRCEGVGFTVDGTRYVIPTNYRSVDDYLSATHAVGFEDVQTVVQEKRMSGLAGSLLAPLPMCFLVRARRRDASGSSGFGRPLSRPPEAEPTEER